MKTQYQMFEPTTRAAMGAADAFIERMAKWDRQRDDAEKALREACSALAAPNGAKALGFISKDTLNMSVCGVVFDKNPGPGFIAAPGAVSTDAQRSGAKGLTYLPDVTTAAGKSILDRMMRLSAVAEERPLLVVDGVDGVSLKDGKLSLAGAMKTEDGIRIFASPSAIKTTASVRLVSESVASIAAPDHFVPTSTSRPVRKLDRPTPFNS